MPVPSRSLHSRIQAFESLKRPSSPPKCGRDLVSSSPPNSSTLYDSTHTAPAIASRSANTIHLSPRSPSPSPPHLGTKASLDLKDWIIDDGASSPLASRQNGFATPATPTKQRKTSLLIQLDQGSPPPLPPRKSSYSSLKSVSSASSAPAPGAQNGKLIPPRRSDSLTIDHTYPPLSSSNLDSASSRKSHAAAASSISSFHSISLSDASTPDTPGSVSDTFISTFPMEAASEDTISLNGSYEDVGTSSIASPSTAAAAMVYGWNNQLANRQPPKLPQRPPSSPPQRSGSSSASSINSTTSTTTTRKPPPVPPPRHNSNRSSLASTSASASDRSSILSVATTTSRSSTSTNSRAKPQSLSAKLLMRPTPVPPAARARYEALFVKNVQQRRRLDADQEKAKEKVGAPSLLSPFAAKKSRQAAGWRGLSVDLITSPEEIPINKSGAQDSSQDENRVGLDERLDGHVVKCVWTKSKLAKGKLSDIWLECDVHKKGSLDREEFTRGMWRIDEELRRAQLKSATSSSSAFRLRQAPPPPPKSRQLLR